VDFHRGEIKATHTKTSRDRFVPMNDNVLAELLRLKENASSERVFANPSTGLPLTDVKTGFTEACRSAGIEDFWFHDLRHTFGTRAADGGAPLTAVASVMGHADIHTTMRYAHATDSGRLRVVEAASEATTGIGRGAVQKLAKKSAGRLERLRVAC
jgi:integrase